MGDTFPKMVCNKNKSLNYFRSIENLFQDNKLTGPASLFSSSGERIEFEYCDGVVHGPAKIKVTEMLFIEYYFTN